MSVSIFVGFLVTLHQNFSFVQTTFSFGFVLLFGLDRLLERKHTCAKCFYLLEIFLFHGTLLKTMCDALKWSSYGIKLHLTSNIQY